MPDDFFTLNKLKQMSSLGGPLDAKTTPVAKDLGKAKKKREKKEEKNKLASEEQEQKEKGDLSRGKIVDILV
ncbi:MAG: hypothetical protein ACPL5I_00270 [Thermodesulfobacteriota bacterium]